jgi:riboflavin kinase/FMN adenylyltransferase
MERWTGIEEYTGAASAEACSLCIGNFDGVHLGHRHVIGTCMGRSRERGLPTVLLTFEPHPLEVLRPRKAPQRLTTPQARALLLAETGIDHLIEQSFDGAFAAVSAEQFVHRYVVDGLNAKLVVVGSRFRFGSRRSGDVDLLKSMGRELGFEVKLARGFRLAGEVVSSRHIRHLLGEEGRVRRAAQLLGRYHSIGGRVVRGGGRGRRMGFPTANLEQIPEIVPAPGVYAGTTTVEGRDLPAAVHVGPRLTFDAVSTVEAHIVGWDHERDLYGVQLELRFLERLRGVERFESREALVSQIEDDVQRVIHLVEDQPPVEVRP